MTKKTTDNASAAAAGAAAGEAREGASVAAALQARIAADIAARGGWVGFDRFMELALYAPGLGYYAHGSRKFGALPASGSDFITAPELSPVFGELLAVQVGEALDATGTHEVWEFGAGSGALAAQLLGALGERVQRYVIVDLSGSLRQRQRQRLAPWGDRVQWLDRLPPAFEGVVVGNEVLDAMPVQLLVRKAGAWHERGVALDGQGGFAWSDRATALRPPLEVAGTHDYLTEVHPQAEGFVRTLAAHLRRGAAFLLDYGFPEAEYYHPQRDMGTLVCHRAHRVDSDPLADPGLKDITAHVNFTGVALAAQEAGLEVLGYTSQAHFLINCGLPAKLEPLGLAQRAHAAKLIMEHEMGELFKVLALGVSGASWAPLGFAQGDPHAQALSRFAAARTASGPGAGPAAAQAEELLAQRRVGQECAAHDGVGHQGPIVAHPAPVHAHVAGLHHQRQPLRAHALLQGVGQHHHGLFLDLRPVHDPFGQARVLRQADEGRVLAGQDADPYPAQDGAQVVRAGAAHADGPDHHQLVHLRHVGEGRDRRRPLVAAGKDLVDEHLGHAPRGFARVVVVVGVDHQRMQHLAHPGLDLAAQLLQLAVLDEVGNVVIGKVALAGLLKAVADAVAGAQVGGADRGRGGRHGVHDVKAVCRRVVKPETAQPACTSTRALGGICLRTWNAARTRPRLAAASSSPKPTQTRGRTVAPARGVSIRLSPRTPSSAWMGDSTQWANLPRST